MPQHITKVLIIPGDGIGPEVIGQARRVLDWFVEHRALAIAIEEAPYGVEAYRRDGELLPKETRAAIERPPCGSRSRDSASATSRRSQRPGWPSMMRTLGVDRWVRWDRRRVSAQR